MMAKIGRPRLSESKKRKRIVKISFNESEMDLIEQAAEHSGETHSALIRRLILPEVREKAMWAEARQAIGNHQGAAQ